MSATPHIPRPAIPSRAAEVSQADRTADTDQHQRQADVEGEARNQMYPSLREQSAAVERHTEEHPAEGGHGRLQGGAEQRHRVSKGQRVRFRKPTGSGRFGFHGLIDISRSPKHFVDLPDMHGLVGDLLSRVLLDRDRSGLLR